MAKIIIDDAVMDNVEILAKLALTEEERAQAKEKMQEILDYMEKLNELDTDNVEPLINLFPEANVFREDLVINEGQKAAMLANAPRKKDGQYLVPKTI